MSRDESKKKHAVEIDHDDIEIEVLEMLELIGITDPTRDEVDKFVKKLINKETQKVEPEHFN